MNMQDKEIRARAREICEAATPGEWRVGREYEIMVSANSIGIMKNNSDTKFVSHARTALPAALDYIEQLEARLAEAIEDFHDYATQGSDNFAPFCKNADKNCVDARGWCIDKNCKGRLYSGFSDKLTPCQEETCGYCVSDSQDVIKHEPLHDFEGNEVFLFDDGCIHMYCQCGCHQLFRANYCPKCGKNLNEPCQDEHEAERGL